MKSKLIIRCIANFLIFFIGVVWGFMGGRDLIPTEPIRYIPMLILLVIGLLFVGIAAQHGLKPDD